MTLSFQPTAGQVALIEPDCPATPGNGLTAAVTGVVAHGLDGSLNLIGVAWPDLIKSSQVVVSIYAPDALYRLKATAQWRGSGQLAIAPIHDVERIQRRRWQRLPLQLGVTLAPQDAPSDEVEGVDGWTLDVSMGGLRVKTNCHLPLGVDQIVMLTLPDGVPLTAKTTVVAADVVEAGGEYRLAFDDLAEPDVLRLTALVGEPVDPGPA